MPIPTPAKTAELGGTLREGATGLDPSAPPAPSSASYLPPTALPGLAGDLLNRLRRLNLVDGGAVDAFLAEHADRFAGGDGEERLGESLIQAGMVTRYQIDRVLAGTTHGLVLGAYRVLDELGSGGMGMVFLAEHALLKRRVAVKVLPVDEDCPASVRQRFYAEMRVLAEIRHANVVLAYDAGELPAPGPNFPELIYLVMELVEGGDLDRYVLTNGSRGPAEACDSIRQAACGLHAAHDRHLIHRDMKPSNLLRTASGQIKVVDFGLARQFCSRLTDPRVLLGSVEFMAPEQSHDPSAVGKQADVYGLGATLFWLLTGQAPYPFTRNVGSALRALQDEPPRRLRSLRKNAPPELDALVAQMLERNPNHRPPGPLAVFNALAPFLNDHLGVVTTSAPVGRTAAAVPKARRRALIVDDEPSVRLLHRILLAQLDCDCVEAADGKATLTAARDGPFDLVLLDLNLPDQDGYEICQRLREQGGSHLKIIVVSARGDQNALAESLPRGADDYVAKPYEPRQLTAKVQHALRLQDAQDRADLLADRLREVNGQLRQSLDARAADVREAHNALLFTMAKMAESRDGETGGHLRRLQGYTRALAKQAARERPWFGQVDDRFLEHLDCCVPLHDIGKIALPDGVLLKPGALDRNERLLVETHPLIGDRILEALAREHGSSLEFLGMARAIVRHHHERYDGRGYPDKLAGDAIPAAARLVAVADVYDALRRQRLHKPAMRHADALLLLLDRSPGQFDPSLLAALTGCHAQLERIYRDVSE